MRNELIENAPIMSAMPGALKMLVSWSETEKRPVSFEEYIANKFPSLATSLNIKSPEFDLEIKALDELTDEEKQQITLGAYECISEDRNVCIVNDIFTPENLSEEIRRKSLFGQELIELSIGVSRWFIELAEAGKWRLPTEEELSYNYKQDNQTS